MPWEKNPVIIHLDGREFALEISVKVEENFGAILMNGTWFMSVDLGFMIQ